MSSGLRTAYSLAESLRMPYYDGDLETTLEFVLNKLPIGEVRIMLKRNFSTAAWLPPVGKRDAHTIYYGDRMLDSTLSWFLKKYEITGMPDEAAREELALNRAKASWAAAVASVKRLKRGKAAVDALGPEPSAVLPAAVMDEQYQWLKTAAPALWPKFLEIALKSVKSFARHERCHARMTPRDLVRVNKDLALFKIPFALFNIFEDARIEHASRAELKSLFDWAEFQDPPPMDNPLNVFLRLVFFEGEVDTEALESEEVCAPGTRTVEDIAESVRSYYDRAVLCPTAEHLYPLMKEFLTEFSEYIPEDIPATKSSPGKPSSGLPTGGSSSSGESYAPDLADALEASEKGDEFLEEMDKDSDVVGGTDEAGKEAEATAKEALKPKDVGRGGAGKTGKPKNVEDGAGSVAETGSGGEASVDDFLAREPGNVSAKYAKRVIELTKKLMRIFQSKKLISYTESESARMSGRHLARGEIRYIHKRNKGGKQKRKYVIVYDCSGSMSGFPDLEGKLFLLALNNIARMGYLEGQLILSGYVSGPGWLRFDFPVSNELILRIAPNHGAEGLQHALADNMDLLKEADEVMVYTDANIVDTPLKRKMFLSNRVLPMGLYVGDKSAAPTMEKHFPYNIIRETIEEVVEALLIRRKK